jgi:hypothetical protein
MRKRVWIPCAIGLIGCLWLVMLKTARVQKSESSQQEAATNQVIPREPTEIIAEIPAVSNSAVPLSNSVSSTPSLAIRNVIPPDLLNNWQAAIEFYGKVIDESNNPISEAKVSFNWAEIPSRDGNRTAKRTSDGEGLFSLRGAHGPSLSVSVSKEGYYTSRRDNDSPSYGRLGAGSFSPDPQNPVLFHLRRKGTPEPLVAIKRNFPVPRDGTPVALDLSNGATAPSEVGNVIVRCWTSDQGKHSGEKYDWRCVVTIPNGGIITMDEEFPFLAPQTEYKPSTEINMPAERNDWKDDVELKFYYRLADGRYGRMIFSMVAGGQHFCMVDSVLNPNGSRNLEPAN